MLISTAILFVISMAVMLYYSSTKRIYIAQEVPMENARRVAVDNFSGWTESKVSPLLFEHQDTTRQELIIPLPEAVKADDIRIENYYGEHLLQINLGGKYSEFYQNHFLSGNYQHIENGFYADEEKVTQLIFQLDDLLEYQYEYDVNQLKLTFVRPAGIYESIVVIDPAGDGMKANGVIEDSLTLKLAEQVSERFKDSDIKVFLTRMDERAKTMENRLQVVNDLHPDMLISLQVEKSSQSTDYGLVGFYNASYVIPGFGNVELADLLERETALALGCKSNGLFLASEENLLLTKAQIPAAALSIGYISNEKDAQMLKNPEAQSKMADAIASVIKKAFEKINENKMITIESE